MLKNDNKNMNNLWIFVDETGTSSLDDNSNPIFGLGFLTATDPVLISKILAKIKYQVWVKTDFKDQLISSFHASSGKNPKWVKNLFYDELFSALKKVAFFQDFNFNFITKKQVGDYLEDKLFFNLESIKNLETKGIGSQTLTNFTFYFEFHKFWLIQTYIFLLHNYLSRFLPLKNTGKINLVLSKIFNKKEEKIIYKTLKNSLANIDLEIYWVDNQGDYACQLADYFSWTVNRFVVKKDKKQAIGFTFLEKSKRFEMADITRIFCQDYLLKEINLFNLNKDKKPKNKRKIEEILANLTKQNTPPIGSSYSPENLISPS